MRNHSAIWPSAEWHLNRFNPDEPIFYFSPKTLQDTARKFLEGFGGVVTYAVKANDQVVVLENLVGAGLRAFDVASPHEMARVRDVLPEAELHYHNPIRSTDEIACAIGHGIRSWSVDCLSELEKLIGVPREGTEIAVRLRLPIKGGAYDFGEKFGATPEEAIPLLRRVVDMGFIPTMTFHPGTQCVDPKAWATYIGRVAQIAQDAGVTLARLNVGGGFAAHRVGQAPDLKMVFSCIAHEVTKAFGEVAPELVCEPGRAMVAEAFTLALRIKAIRSDGSLFLNDGIYGSLAELRDMELSDRVIVLRAQQGQLTGPMQDRVVFGPTCDSVDRLPDPMPLPSEVAEGDYLLLEGMGAYSSSISTRFNGYGDQQIITITDA